MKALIVSTKGSKMADIIIPSSPADQEAIRKVIEDCVNSKVCVKAEGDFQTEQYNALAEKYGNKAADYRRMAKDAYNDAYSKSFDQKQEEQETYSIFYETIMKLNNTASEDSDEE